MRRRASNAQRNFETVRNLHNCAIALGVATPSYALTASLDAKTSDSIMTAAIPVTGSLIA